MWVKCSLFISLAMLITSVVLADEPLKPTFNIQTHVQKNGQMTFAGDEWAGTKGEGKRLESFSIKPLHPDSGNWPNCLNIQYMAHLQGIGDTGWHNAPARVGTEGQARRVEAVAFDLIGSCAENYTLKYRCHIQKIGDTEWKNEGRLCGTRGQALRLEAFQLRLRHK